MVGTFYDHEIFITFKLFGIVYLGIENIQGMGKEARNMNFLIRDSGHREGR